MFYEIEINVGHGSEGHSLETTRYIKRFKLLYKDDLIEEAKIETDAAIINQLNHFYKDCPFDFLQAYRKYGVVFQAEARIRNRITEKSSTVYRVQWEKYHWNINQYQFKADELTLL